MILIIDNYDSFVYNLSQLLSSLGHEVRVFRNDRITMEEVKALAPERIVLSPGPGNPANRRDFGVCADILQGAGSEITAPILGVCLGHQGIIHHFGGTVTRAAKPMHGKTSMIQHDGKGLFDGVANPLRVMRYHSLVGVEIPECLEVTARSEDDNTVMAVRHRSLPLYGVQFHPESIMTQDGLRILENFAGRGKA
ncbi:aminodeoxychorismate/anthranilate synthase component II [Candidatus Micrarchaeota archaeon]|nr:aminodeoxychorismate/anthranilate synthase component II [Candidatus Micrarchaeota archaeon]